MKVLKNKMRANLNKKVALSLSGFLIIGGVCLYFIKNTSCKNCVVNENGIKITSSELSNAIKSRETFYKFNNQEISADTLKNDVLKQLKNEKRVQKYAKENNIKATEQEINSLYNERVKQNGNEDALLKKVNDLYGFTKKQYLEVLEKDVLREKVQEKLDIPISDWLNK